jgi:hypothetical protein
LVANALLLCPQGRALVEQAKKHCMRIARIATVDSILLGLIQDIDKQLPRPWAADAAIFPQGADAPTLAIQLFCVIFVAPAIPQGDN